MASQADPVTRRPSFFSDLRCVLGEPGFRRLFATRLISQSGDGIFTAGFGAYVFFSAQTYPDPAAAAAAFAVLYLPYSLVGPFAGVFIDRWSRRQILVASAGIRGALTSVTALLIASGSLGVPLYASALAVLAVNRFFLSALSASLPHVVARDELVMANSVSPTLGGLASTAAGVAGVGMRLALGGGHAAAAVIVLAAGACYLLAGCTALAMRRGQLGPVREPGEPPPPPLAAALAVVVRGLAAGIAYLSRRRAPASALGALGAFRVLYGIVFLMGILLYRNYFYSERQASAALSHFTILVIASAAGYGLAAVVSPPVTRRIPKHAWIVILLAMAGAVMGPLGALFRQVPFLAAGFSLGLAGQGVAISATTIIQEDVADTYRGRAFALYDMMFNALFVGGAFLGALVMPVSGRSYPLIAVVAGGYVLAAAGYAACQRSPAGGSLPAGPAGGTGPSGPAGALPAGAPGASVPPGGPT